MSERKPLLVVAAFWSDSEHKDLLRLTDKRIEGSGAVVTFTPEQANQPGLRHDLRRFKLEEAADWEPEERPMMLVESQSHSDQHADKVPANRHNP